jgi:hypothetical protein
LIFTIEQVIHKSPEEIATTFEKNRGIALWFRGFVHYKILQGDAGKQGTTAILTVQKFGKVIDLTETIVESEFPHSYEKSYETKDFQNYISVKLKIQPIDSYKTKVVGTVYYKLTGRLKWIAFFFPFLLKRNLLKIAQNFKEFLEDTKIT